MLRVFFTKLLWIF